MLFSAEAEEWWLGLDQDDFDAVDAATDLLAERGPNLGRPLVGSVKGSRHHNMKELRVRTLRALFVFDPRRRAVVLLGGDKRGDWSGWYQRNIPLADELYDSYLREEM